MDINAADIAGDLALLPGGIVDGWCWSPSRAGERLRVDILIEGATAARIEASVFRRDLLLLRIGDGRHGFRLKLPRGALTPERTGCLIEVRELLSGQVFGRWLHEPAGAPAPRHAALDAAAATLDEAANILAGLTRPRAPLATALRRALGDLSIVLPAAAAGDVAVARARLAALGTTTLPWIDAPRFTVAVAASARTSAVAALERLRALAPLAARMAAEVVLVDPGHDARLALLPSVVANLRYAADLGEAVTQARGGYFVLLDADAPDASAAVLGELLARPGVRDCLLLPPGFADAVEAWPVAAPVGVILAAPLALLGGGELAHAALLRRARAGGVSCRALAEPWAPPLAACA
jgi:hypothetical protein